MNNNHVEDSVESLVKRLEAQGKKFKIVYEDEEEEAKQLHHENAKSKEGTSSEGEDEIEENLTSKHKKRQSFAKGHDSVDFSKPIEEMEKLEKEK